MIHCPKCRADITDAIPASCAAHLHPALVAAYASIKRQFAPRKRFDEKSLLPKHRDFSRPIGERAVFERLESEWWENTGLPALRAAYPEE